MFARIVIVAGVTSLVAAPAAAAQTAVTITGPTFAKTIDAAEIERWGGAIQYAWLEGEAAERGISVTDADVNEELEEHRRELNLKTKAAYERYVRKTLHRTLAEHRVRTRADILTREIRNQVTEPAAKSVTPEQIEAFVQANPRTEPAQRRLKLIRAKSRAEAKRVFKKIRRGLTFKSAHRRYSREPDLTVTMYEEPDAVRLDRAVFEAKRNTLTRYGKYVFKIIKITPERPAPINEQRATAWEILATQAQQQAYETFTQTHRAKWLARTTCAPAFASHPDCPEHPPTGE